ncbi:nuclear transport factor 2 family protein [Micromonospora yasonensis]|uniref:nuclear transport factor 2 family protein n=1 Tax=Micromonospora yasonensis TaxID=1128667 RepID=UPI00222E1239|nr:nuclear transport factor 2 family protein [Micromonospora yasonensis]MCW3841076.1 nuclear transport factor 2 family protein [Micromonospora yasonensis]
MINNEASGDAVATDRAAIADIVRTFFAAFTSGADSSARLDALRQVFLPEAVIIATCGREPAVYGVESFIVPRQALLSGGTLVDFREWELSGRTEVFGDIAHHFCSYAKTGVQDGAPFTARGMKTLQFVRTSAGWRISAVAWDDERDGLVIESGQ